MSTGVKKCIEAFERLIENKPHLANHVGLPKNKITAGVVSVEAGFDRGYLKRARPAHKALIARVDEYKKVESERGISRAEEVRRAKNRLEKLIHSERAARSMAYNLMSKNLILIERIRELENQKASGQNVHKF